MWVRDIVYFDNLGGGGGHSATTYVTWLIHMWHDTIAARETRTKFVPLSFPSKTRLLGLSHPKWGYWLIQEKKDRWFILQAVGRRHIFTSIHWRHHQIRSFCIIELVPRGNTESCPIIIIFLTSSYLSPAESYSRFTWMNLTLCDAVCRSMLQRTVCTLHDNLVLLATIT